MMKCDPFEPHPFNSLCFEFGASVHQVHHFSRALLSKTRPKPEFFGVLGKFPHGGRGENGALDAPMHLTQNELN